MHEKPPATMWSPAASRMRNHAAQLLRALNEHGSTVCMVTHDSRYAQHADREVALFDGRVVDAVVA